MSVYEPELFQKFCATDVFRYALDRPFVQSGKRFATDGKIAICCVTSEPDSTRDRRLPNMAKIMDFETKANTPWDYGQTMCSACGGNGSTECTLCDDCNGSGSCPHCSGSGEQSCSECGHDHDCDECLGDGSCCKCCGVGSAPAYSVACGECCGRQVSVGGWWLDIELARRIELLDSVLYTIVEGRLVFESGEIRGLVLCSRSPSHGAFTKLSQEVQS